MHVVDDDDDDDDLKDDEKSLFFTNMHTDTSWITCIEERLEVRLITSHCLNEHRILTLCLGW